ncbi:ribosome biogenesis GTPase Der [Chondrinema litorale]|uniref:ribosome biogenesis GTPase Der n=1 Tax=Chondrinema litorale TaxID=2994555 RepID=UPI00254470A6|nr:ribosome biogenesis GTPase Der [Chondrinema litorale]UZR95563.1 ribosome biogenesis GTPase Der [Chondrinema litorale]
MANIVAIVGRPNVGKSTLYNRLVESRDAIVDNFSGVTRDRHYGTSEWTGVGFTVIDTGGYVVGSEDVFEGAIREQVEIAIEEANVILFVVDTATGLNGLDKDFANVLRSSEKPVFLVANKADTTERVHMTGEFYALGMGEVYPISAMNGSGTGELLDELVKNFSTEEEPKEEYPRISIVGRPNVGKSSFINALLNQSRNIVTNEAGTTRDSNDALYNAFDKKFILTDTAGIRKKAKVRENIEFYSVLRALKAIEDSDVCIVVLDATRGLEAQDLNIIFQAQKHRKGIVIMVNKWDLIEKDSNTAKKYEDELNERLAPNTYIPIIFTSVISKQRIYKTIEKAIEVYENKKKKISTSTLNEVLLKEIERYPPPSLKGKFIKIKYITQLPTYTPTFAFFCNHPKYIKAPYERFLENQIRKHFEFEGVPIKTVFRKK